MPAVVVTGARQTGKSTLVKELAPGARRYVSLDDLDVLDAARRDPETLLGGRQSVTIGRWDDLLAASDEDWLDVLSSEERAPEDWRARARRGGFPTPAVHMRTTRERSVWFDGYVRTYLERDLQDLSAIAALPDFRRLMQAAALRIGQLLNQTELGRDVSLAQPTVHRYLNLLAGSRRPSAAHGQHAPVADPRRPGRSLVAGRIRIPTRRSTS